MYNQKICCNGTMRPNMIKVKNIAVKRANTGWVRNPKGKKKSIWVSFTTDGYVYLSYSGDLFPGRAYWILSKISPSKRPNIRASDRTHTLWLNSYGIRFDRRLDYERAKKALLPYRRRYVSLGKVRNA
jgi:hypothetical protein